MSDRTCGWCDASLDGMSAQAQYCSMQHKKNAASRRHRARNPGYYRRYNGSPTRVAWKAANADRIRAYAREQQRQYRIDHPEHARAWWAANAEKRRLYQADQRAKAYANPTSVGISERDWVRLVNRHLGRCFYCDVRPDSLQMDHVVPLVRGGRHAISNVVPACQPCNSRKGSRLLVEWLTRERDARLG